MAALSNEQPEPNASFYLIIGLALFTEPPVDTWKTMFGLIGHKVLFCIGFFWRRAHFDTVHLSLWIIRVLHHRVLEEMTVSVCSIHPIVQLLLNSEINE